MERVMDLSNQSILDLSGRTAVVTGGAVGIGQGIAARLLAAGANVVVADVSDEHLAEARAYFKQSSQVTYIKTDVSNGDDIVAMVDAAVKAYGGLDILVNNAGIYPPKPVLDMTFADFEKVLHVNLLGAFMATKTAAEQMIKQGKGGKIINITSIDALHPSSVGLAHYDASKHGMWGFTKNVAIELAPHNIWVNAVAPGGITTPGAVAMQKGMKLPEGIDMAKMMETFMRKIPMRRMGEPDDIGKAVLFLASDMASYMTGAQIVVDGGVLLS